MNQEQMNKIMKDLLEETENHFTEHYEEEAKCFQLLNDYLGRFGKTTSDDYSMIISDKFMRASIADRIKILEDALDNDISVEESELYNKIDDYEIEEGPIK